MSLENNEFQIPFNLSRRGKKEEINFKSIGRRIGSAAASRLIDRPNIGGKRRRGARGLGMPDGDLNPRTRIDVDGDGTIFDNIPGWEQPDPTLPRNSTPSLASGAEKSEKPSFPRKPTYGPFIDDATKKFGGAKTWEEFKEIYENTEITYIDYETTGLVFDEFNESSGNGSPTQLGAVKMKGGKVVARFETYINPGIPTEQWEKWSRDTLVDYDGKPITNDFIQRQISIAEAHKKLAEFIGPNAILGVQNAAFDKDVLEDNLVASGIDWRPDGWIDLKDVAEMSLPRWSEDNQDGPKKFNKKENKFVPSNSLKDITEYLEVELGDKHHTADADAEATAKSMAALIDRAIDSDWPTNLFDAQKREAKLKKEADNYDSGIKTFRSEKEKYIAELKAEQDVSLSSGAKKRPIIKVTPPVAKTQTNKKRPLIVFGKDEKKILSQHRATNYKYGDESVLGGAVRATKNNWLKGMTSQQIAELIVPKSKDQHFMMWADDLAPGAYDNPATRAAFKKYYDEILTNSPWDEVDYSEANIRASQDAIALLLDSSPQMKWAVENHGTPFVGVMSAKAVSNYEAIPEVANKLDMLQRSRGVEKRPYVRARLVPGTNMLIFNKRMLIDRESSLSNEKIPFMWSDTHMPLASDSHIDNSVVSTIPHEWGHWLVFRALKDLENRVGSKKDNKSNFFGSGDTEDDNYLKALLTAEKYTDTEMNPKLMALWDAGTPIEDTKDTSRVLTSYGHVNPAETFAEGVVAYFHPNPEVRKNAINQTLRDDIEAIIGNGDGKKPWDENKDFEIALSSGRTSSQRSARRETNLNASEQVFSSTSEDDRELARLDYSLSLSSGAIVPESGSRKLGIINDFDDRNNDGFATPIRNVRFRDSNGEDVEYTIFATGKLGDAVYVFEKSKLDKYISDKEKSISLANGVPFEDVGVSVISRMTEEREIRNKKNGLVGKMSIFPPTENMVVGKLRMSGNKNGTSIIDEIAIDKKHQRRGLASALFKYHRDFWPDQDLHHSSTLSDDGKAFAAATPFDDNDISLSSGAKYAEIVRNQPKLSNEQFDSSENFKELIQLDELRKEDTLATTGVDAFGDDITELADSEDRANIKKDIQQSLETLFSYEMELDESIIVSSNSGEKINLGNKVKVTAVYSDVGVSSLTENDILEQVKELEYMFIGEDGKPLTRIDVKFKISPADSSSTEKLLALGVPQSLIDVDNPGTNIELGRAHRAILTDGSKTVVIHESISIGKDARKNGLASAFNARNESLYRGIDADSIITYGMSSTTSDQLGATHWARNGFTILGEPSRQKFIGVIDDAILNKPDSFSEEEIKRISSLYKKDKKTGKFISSATPEELIDFTKADEIFKLANNGDGTAIFFTREVAKPSGINRVTNRINRRVGSERIREQSDSVSLSSRAGHKTKLNVERYGKNGEYSEVSSFEINGETFNVSRGGDSPGRGAYNGYLAAFDNGENIAHIDYQLDTNDFKAVVAMVFTKEEYRRSGIAEALLDSLMLENPDYELSPGYTTEDGAKWWRSVTGGDGPIKASLSKNRSDSPSLSSGAFDYRGLHGAPGRGSGAPLHDLVSPDYSVYPEDVYSSNAIKYYGVGDDNFDAAALDLIRRFKGKPNAEVTIYRAAPVSKAKRIEELEKQIARYMSRGKRPAGFDRNIEPHVWSQNTRDEIERLKKLPPEDLSIRQGDWVTPIRSYAVSHGDGALRGDYEIVKKRVKAKHVYTAGDSWLEWGYDDSKGSLSISSGAQSKINLTDEEKREIINIASQRTDSFSKSVVAQFRQNGYLSEKQWTALNRMTLRRNRSGPSLSSGSLINSKKYKKTHTASLKKILKRMDKEGSGWMDEDMRIARLDELESHFGKTLRETVEYWYGGADDVTYNMREEIEEGRASKEVGELLGLIDISPTTSRPIYRGMRYLTQDQLDEIINRGVKLPLGAFSGQKSTALSYADGDSFNKTQVSVVFRLEPGVKAFPMKHFSPIDEEEYLVSGTFEVVNVSQTPFGRFGRTVTEVEIRQTDSGQSLSSGAKPQFLLIGNQAAARGLNTDTNQKRESDGPSLSSGSVGIEEFKNMSNEEHARILSEAGLSQRGEAEAAGQAIWNEGFPGLYQVTLEHAGDLYNRSQHRLTDGAYGLDELDEKLTKLIRWLEAKYDFRRDVEEQTEQQIRNVDPSLSRDLLVSLGKKYADAHSKLPVYTLPTELMVKASMHLGNWEFEDAAKTLKELKEMLKDKKKWRFMLSRQGTIQYLESKKLNGDPSLISEVLDSKSTENFTSTKAIEKLEQANEILDRIAPDGDILQKVLGLRESESQKLSVGSNLPLTDKEVEFIGDVVSVGTLINEAIEQEVINLGGSDGDAVAKLQAEFSLLNENMLLYGPTVLKLQKDISKFKAKKPISVHATIHGVPENSKGLDSFEYSGFMKLYPQFNADELLSIIEKNKELGVDNYVLGLSETVPDRAKLIWQDISFQPRFSSPDELTAWLNGQPRISRRADEQPTPDFFTREIILRTNRNESYESDQEKLEIVKKNLPLVRDVQQLLRNVRKALMQKQNNTASTPLDTTISQGYRFSDKEILDLATQINFPYDEMEDIVHNYHLKQDEYGKIQRLSHIGEKDAKDWGIFKYKDSNGISIGKPDDEVWIMSVESTSDLLSEQLSYPPHRFRISFNPITEESNIELIEAIVHGTNIKSGDKIVEVSMAERALRETIRRHTQSLRLSKEEKQELFIRKFREVAESEKVAKAFKAVDVGPTLTTELNINGEVYPAGTNYNVLEDAASRANELRSRLQNELKNTRTTPTENFKGEVIKKALQAVGVEFTGPKDVPIIIAQLKPTQKKQDFNNFLRLSVLQLRDEPKALVAYLKKMRSDIGSHEYSGEDGPEILARLEEITSMIPKALTDGSLSGNLGDTQYDTRTGNKQIHWSLAQTVGAPLKLIYRVVPGMKRAHANNFGAGLTVITQERPKDETKVRWMSTALHEAFHGVENANPVIKVLEWMFWRSRQKPGEGVVKLRDMPKGKGVGYGNDEIGIIDNWGNLYAGKVYNDYTGTTTGGPLENFEILTTGVQGIFYPETSASTLGDRDHLDFTMGILALARKTTNNESSPTPNAVITSDDGLIRQDDIAKAGEEAAESLSEKDTNRRRRRQKS